MKKSLIAFLLGISFSINAQTYVKAENDTTVLTEYNDGRLWAYRTIGNVMDYINNGHKVE